MTAHTVKVDTKLFNNMNLANVLHVLFLSKERSKAPSESLLKQYVGRLATVDNSPPIHHTKNEVSN